MKTPSIHQLAAIELRLCDLVHPDWLSQALPAAAPATLSNTSAVADHEVRRPLGIAAAISRWLIDQHGLTMLSTRAFARSWCYAVLGGHTATEVLHRQIVGYCAATWVRQAVGGAKVRALHAGLGAELYDQALHTLRPALGWRPPHRIPDDVPSFLHDQGHSLLAALWVRHAPSLAAWARLMTPSTAALPAANVQQDPALLGEIDTMLQEDFALELEDTDDASGEMAAEPATA
jgi:hypothetical protein